jgi:hypothetical protein
VADDLEIKREIVLEADAETLARMRKEDHARGAFGECDSTAEAQRAQSFGVFIYSCFLCALSVSAVNFIAI